MESWFYSEFIKLFIFIHGHIMDAELSYFYFITDKRRIVTESKI